MALGWDMAIADACLNLGVPYIAFVPCEGQELMWKRSWQTRYHDLLAGAQEVKTLAKTYTPGCMLKRNEVMIEAADAMICLWDGSTGGTYHAIGCARKRGIPIENTWEEWLAFRG